MNAYSLIIGIVPQDCGDLITTAAAVAGASGGTILKGRGTATSKILQMLGLGDSSKDMALILVSSEDKDRVVSEVVKTTVARRPHFGTLCSLPVSYMIKAGKMIGEKIMSKDKKYRMITVILNKGFADDAMEAARKAGAGGGTILTGRGTAKKNDGTFFGIPIVPEKELLLILVESEKAPAVIEAVRTLPCLADPGSGISFCSDVDDFTRLGEGKV